MADYEQLLSKDPIGAFEKIRDDYRRYFETMYRFKDLSLDNKKNTVLLQDDNLLKEPYCELLPKYESTGKDLKDLCDPVSGDYYALNPGIRPLPDLFLEFVTGGLMDYKPYRHQFEMLCKGYGKGHDVLITSGTGSGKTESFMLPLLASLLAEAQTWNAPTTPYDASWWQKRDAEGDYQPCQRTGETRQSAIRALLLYPMNALVADQVGRLRKALDSDNVRTLLDQHCAGNRIFFGSYNGKTLRSGEIGKLGVSAEQANKLATSAANGSCDPDDIYVVPRLTDTAFTSEMLVREDMQEKSPDIMITNISMLSIMLMRSGEQKFLDDTRAYYESNPEAKFHLVVDELHLHRGTAGSEVAYLLRMFLERIGVPPMKNGVKNPQLQVYASSASLGSTAQDYLEDFFGIVNPFDIQVGYDLRPVAKASLPALDYQHFDTFYLNNPYSRPYYQLDDAEKDAMQKDFLSKVGYAGAFKDFIEDYAPVIYNDLKGLTTPAITTFPLSDLSKLSASSSNDWIRGFLIFRGNESHPTLPSVRFHQFYRYVDGIWGELLPDSDPDGPIGELLYHPTEVSSSGQHKVLELLRCECCGELFIGGNRTDVDNGVQLSLNSPSLDVIPNSQATPMVQKKTIKEYAVFWPSHATPVQGGWYGGTDPASNEYERFGVVNNGGGYTGREAGNDPCHGAWRLGYLNPSDGSIVYSLPPAMLARRDHYISGYVYYPRSTTNATQYVSEYDNIVLKALPCKCPACEKDYRKRHYTQSPIRSFRTGMGRNNQLLSKELLYQLDPNGEHKPKLIGFSDSRQDAAEQSKLIGREHYRDMLRLVFIKIISQKASGVVNSDLQNLIDVLKLLVTNKMSLAVISASIDGALGVDASDKLALKAIVSSGNPEGQIVTNLDAYRPSIGLVDLNEMISKHPNMIDGELIAELLKLGINPSGAEYSDMYPTRNRMYWDTFYDFTPGREQLKPSSYTLPCDANGRVILGPAIYKNIESNIFKNCFGQYMNVNTEVAGLGYVSSKDIVGVPEVDALERELRTYLAGNGLNIQDVINAFIRIYGDCYRYDGDFYAEPMPNYADFSRALKKSVLKLAQLSGYPDEDRLGNMIAAAMRAVATDPDGKLVLSTPLRFKLAHAGDIYYVCPLCGRVHLHRGGGFCTNASCSGLLPTTPSGIVDDLWESNFISFDVKKEPHEIKRLHSEELTGQTDDQITRLLCFKDIMLGNSSLLTNAIDMLCVTTTMEVGVDIGSLQAVYQGNMPPTRYNYQQRVGRAGRRNQAFSLAFTFCRGRSHDTYYYYQATDRITGGAPAIPTLSVNPIVRGVMNPVVLKRIILKHILMLFSSSRGEWAYPKGTVAQLGGRGFASWDNEIKDEMIQWIEDGVQSGKIKEEIILYYTQQYVDESHQINDLLLNWVKDEVVAQIDEAIRTTTQGDYALAIAEAGLLPMYGMPAASRNFYHNGYYETVNHAYSEHFTGVIDRPIEQSISEFAPGAIKTKDSAEYQSAGLTVPLNDVCSFGCKTLQALDDMNEHLDPLQYSFNLNMDGVEISSIQPYNPAVIDPTDHSVVRLVVPKAFRTDKIFDNKGDYCQEDDSRSNFSSLSVWVDASSSSPTQFAGGAAKWEVWNGDNQKGDVWYVNTNNGEFFRGQYAMKAGAQYTYEPRYFRAQLTNVNRAQVLRHAPNFMIEPYFKRWPDGPWTTAGAPEAIAIGTKKITDILCLSFDPACIPAVLDLDARRGNKPAIIAAMYSAATLIQRAFADEIDIQPEEIEISEVKINPINGLPSVYLNDKAANGAGYVSLLCKVDPTTQKTKLQAIMEDIVSPAPSNSFARAVFAHKDTCSTACPKCLNTFYNSSLHHVLDWRLGVDIIKLMLDQTYDMGYWDLGTTPYGDLAKSLNELGKRIQDAHPMGNVVYHPNDLTDWRTGYFETKVLGRIMKEHLVHPLWNVDAQNSIDGYYAQNSFNLQRVVKLLPNPCHSVAQISIPVAPPTQAPSVPTSIDTSTADNGGWGSLS